jgi:membrane protein required for colicin V production
MEIADILLLVIVLVAGWFGYQKGFLIELLSLLAIIFAFAIAWRLSHQAVISIHHWLDWDLRVLGSIAFVTILLLVFYLSYLVSKLLTDVLHKTIFGVFDKILGALMSAVKWLFALSLLFWVLNVAKVDWYLAQKEKSKALSYCEQIAPKTFEWVRVAVPFEDIFGQIKKSIE